MRSLVPAVLCLIGAAEAAFGCSCAPGVTTADNYERAQHVFRGHVRTIALTPVPAHLTDSTWLNPDSYGPPPSIVTATFELIATIKGQPESLLAVFTHRDEATCGARIERDTEHVFFADGDGVIGLCTGTISRTNPYWSEILQEVLRIQATTGRRPPLPTSE